MPKPETATACQCDPTFTPSPEQQWACLCEVCGPLGLDLDPATWRTLAPCLACAEVCDLQP
jgi:hypothetical protein